jgi:DNA-binding transcriptional MerR regulator
MHTISMLRRTLGLSSDNQVRNRIERIKDLLSVHIRRGPNNQIFITDAGLELLKQLQELHDTGLTLAEASNVLIAKDHKYESNENAVSSSFASKAMKQGSVDSHLASTLLEEMAQIREHLAALERQLADSPRTVNENPENAAHWWKYLREDIDVP